MPSSVVARRLIPAAWVTFAVHRRPTKPAAVEKLKSVAGWLALDRLTVESLELEEYLLFTAVTDGGEVLDQKRDRLERWADDKVSIEKRRAQRVDEQHRLQSERPFLIRWSAA